MRFTCCRRTEAGRRLAHGQLAGIRQRGARLRSGHSAGYARPTGPGQQLRVCYIHQVS